ncbi:endonuclease/exonuclease/phosphatase family protein [Streptomyces europaeiscabiei]|uniref:endonuclease/exonuclease/phosphatase family protein n=1 Tax=Streptomyces europaeiscabiei TaxID=146819 RepID=UPI002E17C9D8
MTIRIATFNAENLFQRPKAFGLADEERRKKILEDFATLVSLLDRDPYTAPDKRKIAALLEEHTYNSTRAEPRSIIVNEPRGGAKLHTTSKGADDRTVVEVIANGRSSWAGWAELERGDIRRIAVENTARVIAEVDADILLTVEVEDRLTLDRFNTQILNTEILGASSGARPYPYNLLVDGNDSRGIDVGILSRFPVRSVRSHIFDGTEKGGDPVFSRDCPEFEIELPGGDSLWVLGNHLKSKGFGTAKENDEKRLKQAKEVRKIYREALKRSAHVVVAGDLNDFFDSPPIMALRRAGLKEAMTHRSYEGTPGTHGTGNSPEQKLDYLMFSPELWARVQGVDVERRGGWAPRTFESFETVTSKITRASDHAALFADLDL